MSNVNFDVSIKGNVPEQLKAMYLASERLEKSLKNVAAMNMSNLNRSFTNAQQRVSSSSLSSGSIVKGALFAGAIMKAGDLLKDVMIDSIDAAMEYSKKVKTFEVLTGGAESGKKMAADLRSLKQSTIMGTSVYKNAQTMMGFGIDQRDVIKDLKQIGDIAMGDTERMASLTLAFSQVKAAGKLMGQDLLQFVNAGFNPLNTMSKKWKEFGFTSKKTVGELKDLMSAGKISSEMVAKAFEIATSKGGQFYGMMDKIAETSAGQMLKMKGAWESTKIDMGNALMPIANAFIQLSTDTLHFMNISTSATSAIRSERSEVNFLFEQITKLNEGNENRQHFLERLNSKYPSLLNNIDLEKVKNEELLKIIKEVNVEYGKKEKYSITDANLEKLNSKAERARREAKEWTDKASDIMDPEVSGVWKAFNTEASASNGRTAEENTRDLYLRRAEAAYKKADNYYDQAEPFKTEDKLNTTQKLLDEARKVSKLDAEKAEERWGKDWKKVQEDITNTIPTVMSKEMLSMRNIAGIPGANMFGSEKVNKTQEELLRKLMDKRADDPSSASSKASELERKKGLKVTGNGNKQFNITINGGLVNQENTFERGDAGYQEDASLIEKTIIKGIVDTLNALPGYTK